MVMLLVAKYCEDWMKNVVFRREILHMAQNTEIRLPRMRAKYFRFLSQTNSAFKIKSAIGVSNLVKIGETRYMFKRTQSLSNAYL